MESSNAFFLTAQSQYEPEARAEEFLTLERLNAGFDAWLDVVYHQTIHSDTGQRPQVRYNEHLIALRQADMEAVVESFLKQENRTVNKTFSDIRLNNCFYKVDPSLRSDRVNIRYDLRSSCREVLVYSLTDVYLGKGILHNREEGQDTPPAPPESPVRFNVLNMMIEKHEAKCASIPNEINYQQQDRSRHWTFDSFAACMADLLGLKGGISSFRGEELTTLKQVYDQQPHLTRTLLKKAFARAAYPTVPSIIHALGHNQSPQSTDHHKEK